MLIGSLPVKDVVWGSPSSSKAAMIRAQKKGDDDGEKEKRGGEKEGQLRGLIAFCEISPLSYSYFHLPACDPDPATTANVAYESAPLEAENCEEERCTSLCRR